MGRGEAGVGVGVDRLGGRGATGSENIVGAALVLYRQLPKVKRYLAYLPEGPVIDWDTEDLDTCLAPMAAHLRGRVPSASGSGLRS